MPAAFAAAASFSTSAPSSVARRRFTTETKPIFLTSTTDSGVIAPAQATVVSILARFLMPGTWSLVTCWAMTDAPLRADATTTAATNIRERMKVSFLRHAESHQGVGVSETADWGAAREIHGVAVSGRAHRVLAHRHRRVGRPLTGLRIESLDRRPRALGCGALAAEHQEFALVDRRGTTAARDRKHRPRRPGVGGRIVDVVAIDAVVAGIGAAADDVDLAVDRAERQVIARLRQRCRGRPGIGLRVVDV